MRWRSSESPTAREGVESGLEPSLGARSLSPSRCAILTTVVRVAALAGEGPLLLGDDGARNRASRSTLHSLVQRRATNAAPVELMVEQVARVVVAAHRPATARARLHQLLTTAHAAVGPPSEVYELVELVDERQVDAKHVPRLGFEPRYSNQPQNKSTDSAIGSTGSQKALPARRNAPSVRDHDARPTSPWGPPSSTLVQRV